MNSRYTVSFEKKAIKQLRKIDRSQQAMIISYIEKNLEGATEPRKYGGPLKGNLKSYWRYKIGDYRIIAEINDQEVKIFVIDVGHRKEIYEKIR
jgi:mRNA interferase RelE/StbE